MGWEGTSLEPSHNCVANILMWVGFVFSIFIQDTRVPTMQRERERERESIK